MYDTSDTNCSNSNNTNEAIINSTKSPVEKEFLRFKEEIYRLYEDKLMKWLDERPQRISEKIVKEIEEQYGQNFHKRYRMAKMRNYFSLKWLIKSYNENYKDEGKTHPFTHFNDKALFDYIMDASDRGYDEGL